MMQEADFRQAIAARHGPLPHARFGVYRNNVDVGLATALAVRYPMLQRLAGEAGFTRLVSDFVAAGHAPASPVLIDYGPELPAFCASHEISEQLPFIAELAELESRWWLAYHAAEAEPLDAAAFAEAAQQIEGLRFGFHPSVSLLMAQWPVGGIWQALQRGEPVDAVQPAPEAVLVSRPGADVRVEIVQSPRAEFLRDLMAGATLTVAVERAIAVHPAFDLQSEFRALIAAQLIIRTDRTT